VILLGTGCGKPESQPSTPSPTAQVGTNPIYSTYQFDLSDEVIRVGTQPLYAPTGLISEAMQRDQVLHAELKRLGARIQFFGFLKGVDINHFLKRGDLNAAIGGDMPTLSAVANQNVVVVSLVDQGFLSVVGGKPMKVKNLAGKRIGYPLGSNAHYALLQALSSVGLTAKDVRLVALDIDAMPAALAAGTIDAFSSWEPTPTLALKSVPGSVAVHKSLSYVYLYFARATAEARPEVIHQILAAEVRALRWMRSDPNNLRLAAGWLLDAIDKLTGSRPDISVDEIAAMANSGLVGATDWPAMPRETMDATGALQLEFHFMQEQNMAPRDMAWDSMRQCFSPQYLEAVRADRGAFLLDEFKYE